MGKPNSDQALFERLHQQSLGDEEVIELGPTLPTAGAAREKMRARLSHGYVLRLTFDEAVKRRLEVDGEGTAAPRAVDETTFDADVERIRTMSDEEARRFDLEVCDARMETRLERGLRVWPEKSGGYGRNVFGIAYDALSGIWNMTNSTGLHATCATFLRIGTDEPLAVISGLIFQLESIQTPVMCPFGYPLLPPELVRKAVEELWAWKRFILITDDPELPEQPPLYRRLFTPEVAERICRDYASR